MFKSRSYRSVASESSREVQTKTNTQVQSLILLLLLLLLLYSSSGFLSRIEWLQYPPPNPFPTTKVCELQAPTPEVSLWLRIWDLWSRVFGFVVVFSSLAA